MNGVIILNSYEYLTNLGFILVMSILCVWYLTASIIALFALLKYGYNSWKGPVFLIICIALTITCGCLIPKNKYETRYQVMVDDSVSMNEFQGKYEIIKVEGKIYTVRECGGEAMHRDYQWNKNDIYPICPNCGAKIQEGVE